MDVMNEASCLPVSPVGSLEDQEGGHNWLIRSLWLRRAVGFCGGPPKSRKSWLGLEAAVAIASGKPCLGRFPVEDCGPALVFMAEDSTAEVRERVRQICIRRSIDINELDLNVITASSLRLDNPEQRRLFVATIDRFKPKFLLLDPLIRLHNFDENSAREMSALLGFLRQVQREFDVSIMITHHANKKTHGRPGERLRGSGDLYAFADSALYVFPNGGSFELTVEHRAAPSLDPFQIELSTEDGQTCLEIIDAVSHSDTDINQRVIELLRRSGKPMTRTLIRSQLGVQNQRLSICLNRLLDAGIVSRSSDGWSCGMGKTLFDH
ncbi:MAG: AAA family ATPase [Deltaproteobacteria bacterium]|nr:AAA family ATPase [Deltaproteobacteria bacterium]